MLNKVLKDNSGSAQNWILGIVLVFMLGVGIYVLVFKSLTVKPNAPAQEKTKVSDASLHQALSVTDIATRPNVYIGKNVILIRAVAKDWVTDKAFTIEDAVAKSFGTQYQSGNPMLVMRREAFQLPEVAPDGEIALGESGRLVRAEGNVQYLDIPTLEANWGITFREDEKLALKRYIGRPVLLLQVIKDFELK